MQLQLSKPELEKYITDKVRAGEFPSPEAVVEDAIARVMHGDVVLSDEDLAAIREADAQFERGEVVDFDSFAAEMRKKYCGK
jgi:Arc/MetJ-type ribon-helix-helix transcriptional regulator